jgi:hypothetical protein
MEISKKNLSKAKAKTLSKSKNFPSSSPLSNQSPTA